MNLIAKYAPISAHLAYWLVACLVSANLQAQPNVLTSNYDNNRTNANLAETILTPATVYPDAFGKIGAYPVDGHVFAQPLYVRDVAINGELKNVLYVATMHNSVYAFDADQPQLSEPLWKVNLGEPLPTKYYRRFSDIEKEIGILSTPVINLGHRAIYVVTCTYQNEKPVFTLNALDLTNGADKLGSPMPIKINVPGTGDGSDGKTIPFDPIQHLQRPGLLLANGNIYIAFGSHADEYPFHGWIAAYDAANIQNQVAAYNTTPTGGYGSIWQSGRGLAADKDGNVFVTTGNGDYDGKSNFGQSFLKLSPNLGLVDWATPEHWEQLGHDDADVSSMGPILVPGSDSLVGGDKEGNFYVVNQKNMGRLGSNGSASPKVSQPLEYGGIYNMAVWAREKDALVYLTCEGSWTGAFRLADGVLEPIPLSKIGAAGDAAYQGVAISADGTTEGSGILWLNYGDYSREGVPAIFCAMDAGDITNALWCSTFNEDRDGPGRFAKFVAPTVVNGRVYLPTFSYEVAVYGLLPLPVPSPNSSKR